MHSHPFYKPAGIFFKNEILYRTLSNKTSKKLILEIGSQKWRHSWRKVIHRVIYNIVLKKFRRFWHLSAMFPLKVHSWKSWNWVSYSVGSRLLTSILTLISWMTLIFINNDKKLFHLIFNQWYQIRLIDTCIRSANWCGCKPFFQYSTIKALYFSIETVVFFIILSLSLSCIKYSILTVTVVNDFL